MHSVKLTPEQKFWKFILGDDLDFYEEYTINLSDEEQQEFFADNPDFMSQYSISRDKIYLLRDVVFREILRKIKEYEGGKRKWKRRKYFQDWEQFVRYLLF